MRIEYLEAALSDLDNITDYYFALFGIESAMKVYDQIRENRASLSSLASRLSSVQLKKQHNTSSDIAISNKIVYNYDIIITKL